MKLLLSAIVAALFGASAAQVSPQEKAGIDRALNFWNFTESDLQVRVPVANDGLRFKLVDQSLEAPIAALSPIQKWARTTSAEPDFLFEAWKQLPMLPLMSGLAEAEVKVDPASLTQLPESLRPPVAKILARVLAARKLVAQALAELSPEEKASLVASLPDIAAESSKVRISLAPGTVIGRDAAFALARKIHYGLLGQAAAELEDIRKQDLPQLKQAATLADLARPVSFQVAGQKVWIGTKKNDSVTLDANTFAIDLGGDDSYQGHPGGGLMGVGLLIELGGADQYDLGDLGGGAAVLGLGAVWDLGGHDRFYGKSLTFGSAICGMGILLKDGGHNTYRSVALGQGFGMFGLGLLCDTRGDDRYDVGSFGQGSARTAGIGWLLDESGNDVYTAGGLETGAPLVPQSWTCFAQGAGCGYREDSGGVSGGIGLLADHQGDDVFSAGTYSQGASYWLSLGILWDGNGHDAYLAHYYSQASAMHLTSGYLIDEAGNDIYTVRTGAMHAIGHDYGVAMLLDRAGDDVYSGGDSRPGIGSANGVGLFVDSAGNDRYQGPPGVATGSRDTGSVGLFVDLAGADAYAKGFENGAVKPSPQWAVALDLPDATGPTTPGNSAPRPKPGTVKNPGPPGLSELYSRASKWGVGTLADDVNQATNQLVGIGRPALVWMLDTQLENADRLSLRVFDAMFSAMPTEAGPLLAPYLASPNSNTRANAWRLARTHNVAEALAYLDSGLADPKTRASAIGWAGALRAKEALPKLTEWATGQDESLALNSLVALGRMGSPQTATIFGGLVTDSRLPIRKAAIAGLAKQPDAALSRGTALQKGTLRDQRIGIELLATTATDEALALVVSALDSKSTEIRLEAVRGLAFANAAKYQKVLGRMTEDPDPDVRALAKWAVAQGAKP